MEILLLVLLGGTIRGIGYVISKFISLGKGSSHSMALANAMMDSLITLPIGVYFLVQSKSLNIEMSVLLLAVLSAAFYGANISLQYSSLKRIDLSVMGIVLRMNILFSTLLGVFVLGEKMNLVNYIGLGAILIGNFIVVSRKGKLKLTFGIGFALLAALCSAISANLDKVILNNINSLLYVFLNSFLVAFTLFLMKPKAILGGVQLIRKRFPIFLLFSLLNIAAWIVSSYALQNMDVSRFVPIQKSVTLIIPVLSGILIFHEKENVLQKILGLILAGVGIWLLYVIF